MKTWIRRVGAVATVALVSVASFSTCRKAPPPPLAVHFKATAPGGEPVAEVAVEARGKAQGVTDAKGQLSFQLTGDVGDEFPVTAKLDRPGMQFKPWQQTLVVRKWDAARPETLEYNLEAKLEPTALSSRIELDAGGAPAAAAEVRLDGKPVKPGADGRVSVDLGTKLSRPAKVSVRLKDFEPFEESTELRAGETFVARLVKIGVVYAKVLAAYEAMGRLVPVPDAEVSLAGKPIGKTDKTGSLKYQAPDKE